MLNKKLYIKNKNTFNKMGLFLYSTDARKNKTNKYFFPSIKRTVIANNTSFETSILWFD